MTLITEPSPDMTQVDSVPLDAVPGGAAPRPGRRRDLTRDGEILQASLDVLAETGYDGMTIEMVGLRLGPARRRFTATGPPRPNWSSTQSPA